MFYVTYFWVQWPIGYETSLEAGKAIFEQITADNQKRKSRVVDKAHANQTWITDTSEPRHIIPFKDIPWVFTQKK
jgi:hypothetical protein